MWGIIVGAIISIFTTIAHGIVQFAVAIWPVIVRVFNVLGSVITRVARAIADFARTIATGVQALYDHVIRPVIDAVQTFFERVENFVNRVLEPIKAVLDRINRALDWVWDRIIEPVLDVIERIRAVLRLLAELGVGWAATLNRILQIIEQRIYDTFREVREFVNTFETWIDLLLAPEGWIRSFPFMYTVFRWAGNIQGILTNIGLDPLAGSRRELVRNDNPRRAVPVTVERFRSGFYREHPGVQTAIARLRGRSF